MIRHTYLKHLSKDLEFKDVTDDFSLFRNVFGPKSRDLLSKNNRRRFYQMKILNLVHGKNIKLDSINIWVQRLSYVGELGYELYIKN